MIIITGSVGSGKSEQASRLQHRLNIPRISSSKIIMDNLTPQREARYLAGDLIDDQEAIDLVWPKIQQASPAQKEFILDGFPRTLPQAKWLVGKIKAGKIMFTAILNVPEEVVTKRMLNRQRDIDKQDIIARRLDTYKKMTNPITNYFKEQGFKVNEIDGQAAPDAVEDQIKKVLV
jgi:adenylate kinase